MTVVTIHLYEWVRGVIEQIYQSSKLMAEKKKHITKIIPQTIYN